MEAQLKQVLERLEKIEGENAELRAQRDTSLSANNTSLSLDLKSLQLLESVNVTKPHKFNGMQFEAWQKRLLFYLKQLSEDQYLTMKDPQGGDLDKSRRTAMRILEFVTRDIYEAYFSDEITAFTLYTNLSSDFTSSQNVFRETVGRLFHLRAKDFDNKADFIREFRLTIAKLNTLGHGLKADFAKELFIAAIGGELNQLRPFHDDLAYDKLVAKAESLLNRNPSKRTDQQSLQLLTASQKAKFNSNHKRKQRPANSKFFNKNNQKNNQSNSNTNNNSNSNNTNNHSNSNTNNNNQSQAQQSDGQQPSTSQQCGHVKKKSQLHLLTCLLQKADRLMLYSLWIIDPGSEGHICINASLFQTLDRSAGEGEVVVAGDKGELDVKGVGTVVLELREGTKLVLDNVKYVPDYLANIFYLDNTKNYRWLIYDDKFYLRTPDMQEDLCIGFRRSGTDRLFQLDLKPSELNVLQTTVRAPQAEYTNNVDVHVSTGHPNHHVAKLQDQPHNPHCSECLKSNLRRNIPKDANYIATHPFEVLSIDLIDRIATGIHGYKHCLVIVDVFSKCYWALPLKKKHEAFSKFREFYVKFRAISKNKCLILRSDNGREFVNRKFKKFCKRNQIWHQKTVPGSSFQNGVVERANQFIRHLTTKLLDQTDLPRFYWPYAIGHAGRLHNNQKQPILNGLRPDELFSEYRDNRRLYNYGAKVYFIDPMNTKRCDAKCPGYFLGLPLDQKGYYVLDITKKKVRVVHDLVEVPSFVNNDCANSNVNKNLSELAIVIRFKTIPVNAQAAHDLSSSNELFETANNSIESDNLIEEESSRILPENPEDASSASESSSESGESSESDYPNLQNLNDTLFDSEPEDSQEASEQFANQPQPTQQSSESDSEAEEETDFDPRKVQAIEVPKSYSKIKKLTDPSIWYDAIDREVEAHLETHKSIEPVPIEEGMHILPSHLVFTVKHTKEGPLAKARVVVGGDKQDDSEFHKTYAPTSSYEAVRILLALAAQFGWHVITADIKTAFLHSRIKELLFMRAFPRSRCPPGYCFKLLKSVYGLRQGPADWYSALCSALLEMGFEQAVKDQCIFYKQGIIISFYVDDLFLVGRSIEIMEEHLELLAEHFEVKVNNDLGDYLGVQITRDSMGSYHLSAEKYIEATAQKWDCTHRTNNFQNQLPRSRTDMDISRGKLVTLTEAKSLYGQLSHIMRTGRADISFALCYLGRFIANPTQKLMNYMLHTLKYLYHTRTASLRFDRAEKLSIDAYTDSSFGTAPEGKSYTGYNVLINDTAVIWESEVQSCAAQHVNEAELYACNAGCRQAVYLSQLLHEIVSVITIPTVHTDSSGVLTISENGLTKLTRYVMSKETFVREADEKGLLELKYVNTLENQADGHTKRLDDGKFSEFFYGLGLVDN